MKINVPGVTEARKEGVGRGKKLNGCHLDLPRGDYAGLFIYSSVRYECLC